jgi:hypothetical protein
MSHSPENPEEAEAQPSGRGFLQRWSQRKTDQADVAAPSADLADDAVTHVDTGEVALAEEALADAAVAEQAEEPVLTDDDMQPIETLNADSDYTPFMSEGVSKELRQMALKKLFFSGLFKARDGLDDYDDDFTSFEPLGDTITSDMKFQMRREEKARLAKQEAELEEARAKQAEAELAQTAETDDEADDIVDAPDTKETAPDTDADATDSAAVQPNLDSATDVAPGQPAVHDSDNKPRSTDQTGKAS